MALRGALAASVTPLRNTGDKLDEDALGPLVDFFVDGGLDGILALGTAGEGILLGRMSGGSWPISSSRRRGRLQVAVQCGAQTTAETLGSPRMRRRSAPARSS